ncbi:winged helix-turn-helix domain-containing protein [Williamsia limnetica]|uniref:winged helix-turn-helix domain-containing protein n=1 Tax=Williamsia limnetica TaxID=882452 RepID=UPI000D7C6D41|nr:winged helix-turn-helix domain-containing protein [Williamsia limnetica]
MPGKRPIDPPTAELAERLREVEARLTALEEKTPSADAGTMDSNHRKGAQDNRFWVLEGLREQLGGASGGLIYSGIAPTAAGPVEWQYGHTAQEILELDDDHAAIVADRLAALGSPIRLQLLLAVLGGTTSVADLSALEAMGTTGQVYHHVRILSAAGWLRPAGRGAVQVPPDRVVPAMLALASAL